MHVCRVGRIHIKDLAQHANFTFELTRGLHWEGSDVASTTVAIKGPLTNQTRLIYQ
jgi:hypothetical protein